MNQQRKKERKYNGSEQWQNENCAPLDNKPDPNVGHNTGIQNLREKK